jgi:hypothetical protein
MVRICDICFGKVQQSNQKQTDSSPSKIILDAQVTRLQTEVSSLKEHEQRLSSMLHDAQEQARAKELKASEALQMKVSQLEQASLTLNETLQHQKTELGLFESELANREVWQLPRLKLTS